MPVTNQTTYAKPDRAALELPVTVNGIVITVGKGGFKFHGEDLTLDDDVEFTVTVDPTNDTAVLAYLVKVIADGSVDVVVDEVVSDGVDVPFNFKGSPYELLTRIFFCEVPAAAADLSAVDITAIRVEARPEPVVKGKSRDVPFVRKAIPFESFLNIGGKTR